VERSADELSPLRAGFSVPKKKFRKSVERNRIKRLIREAWRLHKASLYEHILPGKQLHLFFIVTGSEIPTFAVVEAAVQKAIERLHKMPAE